MLLPRDMNPEISVYYYGGRVLELLSVEFDNKVDVVGLYHMMKSQTEISILSFSLTLDWLYLIDAVKINEKGEVIVCS
ncbi:hypothetical protein HCJ57_06960 [Listeria booriae]|uniref:ABC-three component system middle component 6 n=1 Tax=Listeria booriae TaxID=1552123 RepID=UPI0016262677|nr:ABC-three component system middle component 6 [Listeria booriae]MBC2056236.1 hypothetical protein [Listeria booriae]